MSALRLDYFNMDFKNANEKKIRKRRGEIRSLPEIGYLRLDEVLEIIPISRSTWYAGIKNGKYPKPDKRFGDRVAVWSVGDIRKLLIEEEG